MLAPPIFNLDAQALPSGTKSYTLRGRDKCRVEVQHEKRKYFIQAKAGGLRLGAGVSPSVAWAKHGGPTLAWAKVLELMCLDRLYDE